MSIFIVDEKGVDIMRVVTKRKLENSKYQKNKINLLKGRIKRPFKFFYF